MTTYRFYHPMEVRFADLDSFQHVNNAAYFSYMEQARSRYLQHVGLWDGEEMTSLGVILAQTSCEFRRPLGYGDQLRIGAATVEIGGKSFRMKYGIELIDGPICAEGHGTLVAFDYFAKTSIELPESWRSTLMRFDGLA